MYISSLLVNKVFLKDRKLSTATRIKIAIPTILADMLWIAPLIAAGTFMFVALRAHLPFSFHRFIYLKIVTGSVSLGFGTTFLLINSIIFSWMIFHRKTDKRTFQPTRTHSFTGKFDPPRFLKSDSEKTLSSEQTSERSDSSDSEDDNLYDIRFSREFSETEELEFSEAEEDTHTGS